MARKPKNTAALEPDDNPLPRLSLSETGFTGLKVTSKQIIEESQRTFLWPQMIQVVQEMQTDSTISTALNVYTMMLSGVDWYVCPPKDATDVEKERAKFAQSCMDDMEGSWGAFITEAITYLPYGYSIVEKVYRRRLKKNGSKYNDGKIGLKKLAPRGQDTICKWYFSEDGRELEGVGQNINFLENSWRYANLKNEDSVIRINRNKFLLFTADSTKGNPQGRSLLRSVFLPYKQLSLLKDQLMLGVAKDLQGIPTFYIPPKYLDPKASAEDKAVYESFKNIVAGLANGTQQGIILPKIIDQETKEDLVSLELIEAKGGKAFDIPAIITGLQTDILTALSVDVVKLGSNNVGSYSLSSSKENILAMAIEYRLKEMREVLNTDLMRQLYELNGWDTDRMATFEYGDIVSVDQETLSKYVQRVKSVGMLPRTKETVNKVLEGMGVEPLGDDEELTDEMFPEEMQSRAGDGMAKGSGNGTSDNVAGKNNSDDNADNTA